MKQKKMTPEDMSYNKITLSFPDKDETLFRKKYFSDSLIQFRVAYILVILLYGIFGILDYKMFPEYTRLFHTIRFAIVIPLLSATLLLSFTQIFQRIWQSLLLIGFIAGGVGISTMIILVPESHEYYAGLMLIFFAGYFFIKLRFFLATIAGWSTLLLYNLGAIFYDHTPGLTLLNNNFFFISANLIGMFAVYNIEHQIRSNFFLNQQLDIEKKSIEELNKNLEIKVEDRTKELVKAKEYAEESEQQFRNLFESAADAIFIADEDTGIIQDINHAAELLMQNQKNNIIGLHQSMLHPIESKKHAIEIFEEHKNTKDDLNPSKLRTYSIVRLDGTEVPVEISASSTIYRGKKCLVGTFRDISERERTERELMLAKETAEAISANLTSIIEGTTNSIWAFNQNYEILYINHVFQQEFHQTFGILLKPGINLIDSLPEKIRPLWQLRYERVLKNEQFTIEDSVDLGNEIRYFQVGFNPILKKGQVIGASCFGTNVTAQKLAELELIKAKNAAEESERLKSAFLANMSHEIRTPMNGILGFSNLLKEPDLSGEEQGEYIDIIQKSGERMLNIINNIVDISKIEAGLMKIYMTESNINEQIDYLYNFFKPETEIKEIQLSFIKNLPDKDATIYTDKEKLYAILTNLLKNAVNYTDQGSIEFGYVLKGNDLEFFVKDTGIGIAADRQEAIFERFIQADISNKMAQHGAGLGLSISMAFLNMLGGKLWVESEEGVGSTFYFTLPYTDKHQETTILDEHLANEISGQETGLNETGLKVLIAEDDEPSAALISLFIEKSSREIIKAVTGNETVDACRNNPDIDLILLDIQMPELNGYDATRQIRKFNKDIIIIAQTAFSMTGDREDALEAGCNDYISKPIDKQKLQILIEKYFKK